MNKNKIAKIVATTAIASGLIVVATDSVEAKAQVTKNIKNDVSEKVEDIKKGQVVNVNSNVRIRENANEDSQIMGYLTNGQEVEIIGETEGWYQIKSNDVKGYIKFDYIKVLSDTNIVTGTVVNISTTLSVRETSDVLGKELAKLTNGTKLIVIGEEDYWYKIKYENLVGYVYKDYVKVNKENTQIENNFESVQERTISTTKGTVTGVNTSLNVRSGASTSASIIGTLKNGAKVDITGESGNWYKINYSGKVGYVSKDYVKKGTTPQSQPKPEEKPQTETKVTGTVTGITTTLNIRSGASTSASIIGTLKNGAKVDITGESGNWYKINYNGRVGYVSKDYVKKGTTPQSQQKPEEKPQTETKVTGTVTGITTTLNVRSGASTSASIIGTLKNGAKVEITGESGNWYKINYSGKVGYVSKNYVKKGTTPQSQPKPEEKPQTETKVTGTVTGITTTLNIRSGASTSASIIGTLKNGAKVEITGESGNWYKINYNGRVGYVSKDYVKKGGATTPEQKPEDKPQTETKVTGTVTGITTTLNVRSGASTSASIIGTLKNGAKVEITGESGDWYKINYNGKVGYVYKSYIKKGTTGTTGGDGGTSTTTEKKGVVVGISTTLNVRSGASTTASIIGTLRNGAQVTIIGESGNWYKIKFNERVGYVSKDYVREGNSNDGQGQVTQATFENVYAVMSAHIGSPYVWGGAGEYLTSSLLYTLSNRFPADAANGAYSRAWQYVDQGYRAFDCSGLMQWGYAQVGIKIGRTTWDQITCGTEVSLNNLKPGDLLFNTSLTHVGMYIGNGQWIESPNRSANVRVTAVPWGSIGRARRVLK